MRVPERLERGLEQDQRVAEKRAVLHVVEVMAQRPRCPFLGARVPQRSFAQPAIPGLTR